MDKDVLEKDYIKFYLRDQRIQLEWMKTDNQFSKEDIAEMEERIKQLESEYKKILLEEMEQKENGKKI